MRDVVSDYMEVSVSAERIDSAQAEEKAQKADPERRDAEKKEQAPLVKMKKFVEPSTMKAFKQQLETA